MICDILIFQPQVLLLSSQCLFFLRRNDAYASFNLSCLRVGIRSSWVTRRKDSFHCPWRAESRNLEKGPENTSSWLTSLPYYLYDGLVLESSLLDMTKSFFTSPSLLYLPLWEMQGHISSFPKQLLKNRINDSS